MDCCVVIQKEELDLYQLAWREFHDALSSEKKSCF